MAKSYKPKNSNDTSFLKGGGEMGQLTRNFDWDKTILGPASEWPQSLKTTLSIILNSKFPMFLWWGPEFICFYNDAYRPSLGKNGKHPSILGMPAAAAWPEIWDIIKPLIDQVLATGEATWSEDQLIPIYRNGQIEDVYWTFSYSPVADESGSTMGIFVVCNETTSKVNAYRQLEESNAKLQSAMEAESQAQRKIRENERNLRQVILQAPVAIAIFRGPEHIIEIANPSVLKLWGRKAFEVLNKPMLESRTELKSQGIKQLLDAVYRTGKPFLATEFPIQLPRDGHLETVYVNFVYEPLYGADGQINGLIAIGTDVTPQFLARKAIEESEERFRTMAEGSDVMIAVGDEASNPVYFNNAWTKLTGRSMDDLLEFGWADLIHPSDKGIFLSTYLAAFKKREPFTGEFRILSENGNYHWLLAKGPPRFRPDGSFAGYIASCIDITEQKQDDLRKNDFIGMVSHELKTPLTTLMALVQVLHAKLKQSDDPFIPGALDKANKQVKKMSAMINGFLNISRLESGKILICKQEFDLDQLIIEMIDEIQLTVPSHLIEFTPSGNAKLNADRDKIGSVISNLLSNAIKYSTKGTIIEICRTGIDDNMQVSIKDEGIGISERDIEKLFERYYRVESQNTAHIAGFGIGLYLSAEIINHHNGRIWVESEGGQGSTFYFTLPLT